jgi:hypothetical protein
MKEILQIKFTTKGAYQNEVLTRLALLMFEAN